MVFANIWASQQQPAIQYWYSYSNILVATCYYIYSVKFLWVDKFDLGLL